MWKKWLTSSKKFLQMREVHVSFCATEAERLAVYRLRHQVFNEELGGTYPHKDGRIEKPWDAQSYHMQATVDGALAGCLSFYRLSDGPKDEAIDEFWGTAGLSPEEKTKWGIGEQAIVVPEYRSRGVAVALFWHLFASSVEMGIKVGLISCLPELTRYYAPFGWRKTHSGVHPWIGPDVRDVLRHDLHRFDLMLRHGSPLALQLARWWLRGSPLTRPVPEPVREDRKPERLASTRD